MNAHWPVIFGLGLIIVVGCTRPPIEKEPAQSTDPVLGMLYQGIAELNGSIEELNRHISDLQQMPPSSDPNFQELHALDLAGWQLHLQQWMLQRDHLQFSVNQIQRALADPREKPQPAADGLSANSNSLKPWKNSQCIGRNWNGSV